MSTLTSLAIFFTCIAQILCDYGSGCQLHMDETLNGLSVTWGAPGGNNPWAFNHLPQTAEDAETQGWEKIDDGCKDPSLQHIGQRYMLGDDTAVLMLYDAHGYVAGVQRTIPKDVADDGGVIDFTKLSFADQENIKGQDRYVFTVYFVDPKIICTGRSSEEFKKQGPKTQVHIKNGPDYLLPPNTEYSNTLQTQEWTRGYCFPTMGQHYFYKAPKNLNCKNQQPYFLTYDNCGRLIAVGLIVIGHFEGKRYENVPASALKMFIDPPNCLFDMYAPKTNGITGIHMYFTNEPQKISCYK